MSDQQLQLRSPGGSRVQVTLAADPHVTSVGARVRFAGGSFARDFQVGARGYHDTAIRHMLPAVNVDRFLVHGREVVLAEATEGYSGAVATLLGPHHELQTVYGGPVARGSVMSLFGALEIEDSPEGMTVRTRSNTLLDTMLEQLGVFVDGRASVMVPHPRWATPSLPTHRGARTRHGEVWRLALPDKAGSTRVRDHLYIFGGARGTAEIAFTDRTDATDEQLLEWMDQFDVAWLNAV